MNLFERLALTAAVAFVVIGFALLVLLLVTGGVELLRSTYVPSVVEYPYSIGGDTVIIFCKILDAEKRVAYICIRGDPNGLGFRIAEYHMSDRANWVLR